MSNEQSALRRAAATVYLPGDDGYEAGRTTWAVSQDLRPAAVVVPRSADEVAAVVRAAAASGLRVAPIGTGHNVYPFRDLSDTVLLRMTRFDDIEIRPSGVATPRAASVPSTPAGLSGTPAGIARVGAGAVWLPVVEAAQQHDLAGLHGSAVDVGVAGYHANGGLGWYGRQHGLAANHVTAVEIVTADGILVRADATHEADLFWAVRGGGGNFGVITAIEFELLPFGSAYAGMLGWDLTAAPAVLERWRQWTADLPDRVTSAYRHTQFPPVPQIPEPFRGRQWVIVDGAILGDDPEKLLAPLRELRPELDTWAQVPATAVPRIHMDPEGPTPGAADALLLDGLPQSAVDSMLELTGPGSGMGLVAAELRHLGGALSRSAPGGGATSRLDGQYHALAAGFAFDEAGKAATLAEASRFVEAVGAGNSHGRHYLGLHQGADGTRTGYDDATWQRLTTLKAKVDPGRVLRANHEL